MSSAPARAASSIGLALLVLVRSAPASACDPPELPPGYTALGATLPVDGAEGVDIDSPVVFDLHSNAPDAPDGLSVVVTEADSASEVAGTARMDAWGRPYLVWKGAAPLRPRTRYRVVAQLRSAVPIPAAIPGRERVELAFTTGEGRTPAITFAGRMEVELESFEAPDDSTCTPGECVCNPTRKVRRTRARVKLPTISGGVAQRGYATTLTVTPDRPFDFATRKGPLPRGNASLALASGQPLEMLVDFDGTDPFRPCFALRAQDAARNEGIAEPLCLDTPEDPEFGDPLFGCSVGRSGAPGAWPALALLAATAFMRRCRSSVAAVRRS